MKTQNNTAHTHCHLDPTLALRTARSCLGTGALSTKAGRRPCGGCNDCQPCQACEHDAHTHVS